MEEEEGGMETSFFGGVGVGVGRWKTLLLLAGGLLGCRIWGGVAECTKKEAGSIPPPPNSYRLVGQGQKHLSLFLFSSVHGLLLRSKNRKDLDGSGSFPDNIYLPTKYVCSNMLFFDR